MSEKRINRQIKPDTTTNASGLDEIIRKQIQREKKLTPIKVNKTTTVLIKTKHYD